MSVAYEIASCPVCDGEEDEKIAGPEELREEVEALWAFHLRRLRPGTPSRYLTDRVVFSLRPPLRLGRCRRCGTLYRNPRERMREVEETYAEERLDGRVLEGLFEAQRAMYRAQARRLTRVAGGAGAGLEVGSYVGGFLEAARREGWAMEGVDVNEGASDFARSRGFRVHTGTLEELPASARYGAVAIWNCFDQLAAPRAAVRAARERLAPGGLLAIRVPDGGFYAGLRPLLGGPLRGVARTVLAHNNLLGFPYRHGFTPASLGRLLREEGFEPVRVVGDVLVPVADRWTRRWAAWEERAVKSLLRGARPLLPAPWFELYARVAPPSGPRAD
jgi:SAM-dependent methyltransferase